MVQSGPTDDGWATYCLRNQRKVEKIVGHRTLTIKQPLRREAEWFYSKVREIMRGDAP